MANVVIKDGLDGFQEFNDKVVDMVLNGMAIDIERLAKLTVPFKKGQLRSSIQHFKKKDKSYFIIANKEYAAYQEFGGDGSRLVVNYSKAGTGKHFLKGSGELIQKDFNRRYAALIDRM